MRLRPPRCPSRVLASSVLSLSLVCVAFSFVSCLVVSIASRPPRNTLGSSYTRRFLPFFVALLSLSSSRPSPVYLESLGLFWLAHLPLLDVTLDPLSISSLVYLSEPIIILSVRLLKVCPCTLVVFRCF